MKQRLTVIITGLLASLLVLGLLVAAASGQETIYGTFLGDDLTERGYGIVVDGTGRTTVTGYSSSTIFPTSTHGLQPAHGIDVFVTRFTAEGGALDYSLWFNAATLGAEDYGYGIALGGDDSVYIVGSTQSDDFCSFFGNVPGADTSYNGAVDGFLLKVKPDGNGLDYCTFLGGMDLDIAWAVAVDPAGNAYVTGGTWSTDFTPGATSVQDQHQGLRDAFLVRVNPAGTVVEHASFLGGSNQEEGRAIVVNEAGVATITGWTRSNDLITTTGVIGPGPAGGFDAFVTSVDTQTPDLVFSTYLGGADEDRGYALAIDATGNLYPAGLTQSADFPTTPGGFMTSPAGDDDGFLVRLNPTGTTLDYGTYLGGTGPDQVNGLALDPAGNALLTGETQSADFPTSTLALSPTLPGPQSAFVAVLDGAGSALLYGSYLGGSEEDEGFDAAWGPAGEVFVTGATRSTDFPVTAGAFDTTHNGDYDIFVVRQEVPLIWPRIYLPVMVGGG
jgi:hypothetical protein